MTQRRKAVREAYTKTAFDPRVRTGAQVKALIYKCILHICLSDSMARERLIAIFIGLVMVMSAAGFALNAAINQNDNQTPGLNIPTIVTRELTTEEIVYVLSYEGKIIIEYSYQNDTFDQGKVSSLESFAQKQSDFVVLEEYLGNETSLKIIGSQGKILDIGNMTLSDKNLMNTFCDMAIAQPPECLMR